MVVAEAVGGGCDSGRVKVAEIKVLSEEIGLPEEIKCDVNLLLSTLCTHSIQTREGIIVKALDCNAAVTSQDALAKTIYARLFDWLVEKI
ncbi:Myosin-15 [Camellia lanceoleosa]|uniref:Myosin-15 n=1 Tax=Camellia lanceoleosa TaxID=1840588 RepID=A0ACC0H034_9ERIC|nr:Myosin-15 [Camellia lanceoleosa]